MGYLPMKKSKKSDNEKRLCSTPCIAENTITCCYDCLIDCIIQCDEFQNKIPYEKCKTKKA
jgi:hypothetical protein